MGWLCRCPGRVLSVGAALLSGNELTRNSSGNTRPQSSQFAEPLWTDPGLKSGISVLELISALKRSAGGEWIVEHFPKILAREEKATTNIEGSTTLYTTVKYNPINTIQQTLLLSGKVNWTKKSNEARCENRRQSFHASHKRNRYDTRQRTARPAILSNKCATKG